MPGISTYINCDGVTAGMMARRDRFVRLAFETKESFRNCSAPGDDGDGYRI
jgi:hypothetical protein